MLALAFVLLTAPSAEIAPPPRPKACDRDKATCLCPDGDLRCRARAALMLAAATKAPPPEQVAAKKALRSAETKIKASKP